MNGKKNIEISVVIPTYNRAGLIPHAVRSVLDQTMKNVEIIVIDDGSTDGTAEALAPFADSIRYLRQDNAGPGPARNRGIEEASGTWIAFLDSDDRWYPQKLETQYGETVRLGADCSFHDSRHIVRNAPPVESWNRYVHGKRRDRVPLGTGLIPDIFDLLKDSWHFFLMSTMLVRKVVLVEAGAFDPAMRTNQDVDLYFRLSPYGIAYIDRVLLEYDPGPERSFEVASRIRGVKNRNGGSSKTCIFADRISILKKVMTDRLASGDYEHAATAKEMLRKQILSLFKAHLNDGRYAAAFAAMLRYFIAFLPVGFPQRGRQRARGKLRTAT